LVRRLRDDTPRFEIQKSNYFFSQMRNPPNPATAHPNKPSVQVVSGTSLVTGTANALVLTTAKTARPTMKYFNACMIL
jgi:hypothetical protein